MKKCTLLSLVIPAFNESDNILFTIKEIENICKNCSYIENFEIIIVDDHSSDDTFKKVLSLKKDHIKTIRLSPSCPGESLIKDRIAVRY